MSECLYDTDSHVDIDVHIPHETTSTHLTFSPGVVLGRSGTRTKILLGKKLLHAAVLYIQTPPGLGFKHSPVSPQHKMAVISSLQFPSFLGF